MNIYKYILSYYSTPLHFSRACSVCLTESPRRRAVLVGCGHVICRACAERMKKDAGAARIACPLCRKTSEFVPIFEEGIEERPAISESWKSV